MWACLEKRSRIAASHFGADPSAVSLENGTFSFGEDSSISLEELVGQADLRGIRLAADHHSEPPVMIWIGQHSPPDADAPTGTDFIFSYSYAPLSPGACWQGRFIGS